MLNPDEASIEIKKYLRKLVKIINEEASFTFFKVKIVEKKRIDDILCCVDATFPDEYKSLLTNSFLLGLDTELIEKKKAIRTEQDDLKKTEKMLKKDPVFKEYYCGKSDAQLDRGELELEIERLKRELAEFKVSNNYHEIEQEANAVSFEKKEIENQIVSIENNIKNIRNAMAIQAELSLEKVISMYESASVEISDMLKKTLQEVKDFHNNLILTRNNRLSRELRINESALREKNAVLESRG